MIHALGLITLATAAAALVALPKRDVISFITTCDGEQGPNLNDCGLKIRVLVEAPKLTLYLGQGVYD